LGERDDEPEFVAVLAPFFVGNRQDVGCIQIRFEKPRRFSANLQNSEHEKHLHFFRETWVFFRETWVMKQQLSRTPKNIYADIMGFPAIFEINHKELSKIMDFPWFSTQNHETS
jgi:hypothetical protein